MAASQTLAQTERPVVAKYRATATVGAKDNLMLVRAHSKALDDAVQTRTTLATTTTEFACLWPATQRTHIRLPPLPKSSLGPPESWGQRTGLTGVGEARTHAWFMLVRLAPVSPSQAAGSALSPPSSSSSPSAVPPAKKSKVGMRGRVALGEGRGGCDKDRYSIVVVDLLGTPPSRSVCDTLQVAGHVAQVVMDCKKTMAANCGCVAVGGMWMALAARPSNWDKLVGSGKYVQQMVCNTAKFRRIFRATADWVLGVKPGRRAKTSWESGARAKLKAGLVVLERSQVAFPPLCPLAFRCIPRYLVAHEESPCGGKVCGSLPLSCVTQHLTG